MANRFEGFNIFGWAIDDWEQFYQAIEQEMGRERFERVLNDYKSDSFSEIEKLFESAPLPLNLGGQTEKSRLVATDKPMGIFDFGLATRGMYKVPEYFSQKLADEFPNKFESFQLLSGIVPPNLIKGKKGNFYYEDSDGDWYKREYDTDGNLIYYENSDGDWAKFEYDANCKEIYFEKLIIIMQMT
jgi:hypothetical protein